MVFFFSKRGKRIKARDANLKDSLIMTGSFFEDLDSSKLYYNGLRSTSMYATGNPLVGKEFLHSIILSDFSFNSDQKKLFSKNPRKSEKSRKN